MSITSPVYWTPAHTSISVCWSRRRCHQGVQPAQLALGAAIVDFEPLPFDGQAAARYGTLVALTLAANRDPKPRRMDLMIAAIASSRGLPLYTRNKQDFGGLDDMITVIAV